MRACCMHTCARVRVHARCALQVGEQRHEVRQVAHAAGQVGARVVAAVRCAGREARHPCHATRHGVGRHRRQQAPRRVGSLQVAGLIGVGGGGSQARRPQLRLLSFNSSLLRLLLGRSQSAARVRRETVAYCMVCVHRAVRHLALCLMFRVASYQNQCDHSVLKQASTCVTFDIEARIRLLHKQIISPSSTTPYSEHTQVPR